MTFSSLDKLDSIIVTVRSRKVVISSTLAELYQVEPRSLLQAVKRNSARFPDDFMFQLTKSEWDSLRSQNVILEKSKKGEHLKYLPYAFTQEGIAMLSSVLKSTRAIEVNVSIMRAFVQMRSLLSSNRELSRKIAEIESKLGSQDHKIMTLFSAIRQLIEAPEAKKKYPIGFRKK